MCGIWAIFGIPNYGQYISYSMRIAGRGPDCFRMETIPHFKDCCLAFHRLAIVGDLFGMQPMRVRSLPHLYLMYNGEIYNYKMLIKKYNFDVETQCDGEVMLHLYDKFGVEKTSQMLDGVFAFCIVDTKKKEVHLGRDTFGVRPMFVLTKKGIKNASGPLALCSEIKSLVHIEKKHLVDNGHKAELEAFPPGHYASYRLSPDGLVSLLEKGPYTFIGKRPVFETKVQPLSSDHLENIRAIFTEAVRKRLMSQRRIGCLLSGGLDSSLLAGLLTTLAKEAGIDYPIQTFSIGMEGSTDVEAARKVAAHIGSEHHEVIFTPEEGIQAIKDVIYTLETYDTTTVRSSVAMYLVSKYVSEKTDTIVLYAGEGSDELCQGYIYFHNAPSADEADQESRRILKDLHAFDIIRNDRCSAVHGLEVRVPFLDVDFTSYFLSIPAEMRKPRNGIEKWLLRSAFDGLDLIPKEILWRPKEAFSDGITSADPGKWWFEILHKHTSSEVSDKEFEISAKLYPVNTPTTKEEFYYRQIFESYFSGHGSIVPYFWMPRWVKDVSNPSARVLPNYKELRKNQE